jgi:hypothetical protein
MNRPKVKSGLPKQLSLKQNETNDRLSFNKSADIVVEANTDVSIPVVLVEESSTKTRLTANTSSNYSEHLRQKQV